jgi:uncharacterized protein (TIGR02145 family)
LLLFPLFFGCAKLPGDLGVLPTPAPAITGVTPGDGTATVFWTTVDGASSYDLYYNAGTTIDIASAIKLSGVNSPKLVIGLTNGTTYAFAVSTVNGAGESKLSVVQTTIPQAALVIPSAPAISNATAGDGSVTVSWNTVSGASSYNLYYAAGTTVPLTTATKLAGVTSPKQVTGLTNGTQYAFAVSAVNASGESVLSAVLTATPQAGGDTGTVTDTDGNVYQTVTIGTQIWMKENLKTTRYNDGSPIPLVTANVAWSNLAAGGYCWYDDSATYGNSFGALYNGYVVQTGKLAPKGWHVPTDSEWLVLTAFVGGLNAAGGPLKETGTAHWAPPNIAASNTSGFSALGGGYRFGNGSFSNVDSGGYWWSSARNSTSGLWRLVVSYIFEYVLNDSVPTAYYTWGYSVRCVKNTNPTSPSAPVMDSAVAAGAGVTISWNTVSGATSYNLYYKAGTTVDKTTGTKVTGVTSPKQVTTLTNGTQYAFAVSAVNAAGESGLSAVATATPQATATAPTITLQPQSQAVPAGRSMTLSVTATGASPLSYQWFLGGNAISGATSSSYSILSVQTTNAGTYTVRVSNGNLPNATSNGALVTVISTGAVTDTDGNVYDAVTIGTQVWTVQNLKTRKYNDGAPIPLVTDNAAWAALTTPGYCWYENETPAGLSKRTQIPTNIYGALYNGYAVSTGKLAPKGWHVPTDSDWITLTTFLGGESVAGGPLKEAGTADFASPNVGATNSTGFTALPCGTRSIDGTYYGVYNDGDWWSSTVYNITSPWSCNMNCRSAAATRNASNFIDGYSVRCVKNTNANPPALSGLQRPIVMKNIPAGMFVMGSDSSDDYEAAPPHQVTLSAFAMQETDVTQEQYQAVMGTNPAYYTGNLLKPVEQVTWYDAIQFCNALSKLTGLDTVYNTNTGAADFTKDGYRLPTEAQWEYACRAGSATEYWWGPDTTGIDARAWTYSNSPNLTQPVATKLANAWGLYDMTGDVWQWCNDWLGPYAAPPATNPTGATSGSSRIVRGGSWFDDKVGFVIYRSAFRGVDTPTKRTYDYGFRVVLPR